MPNKTVEKVQKTGYDPALFDTDEIGYSIGDDVLNHFDPANISAFVEALGLTPEDLVYQGDAYPIVQDKSELEGVPMFFVQWQFGDSQKFGSYVMVRAVRLDTGEKLSIFDSGTGIRAQLDAETGRRMNAGITAVRQGLSVSGLRRSEYAANEVRPAGVTFYLA